MVSVIIPCYNDGQYLEEAVMSAFESHYKPLEVIIVDDGSKDELTRKVLRSMELAGNKVIYAKHGGPAKARNEGIKRANGEYILPLDADDKISPEYITEAVDILQNNPEVGIVYCRADFFDGRTGMWNLPDFSMGRMLYQNCIFSTGLFRKSDWERAGGYHEEFKRFPEDWDFWLSILGLGLKPYRLDGVYFHYRKRKNTPSRSDNIITYEEKARNMHKVRQRHLALYRQYIQEWGDELISVLYQTEINYKILANEHSLLPQNRWLQLSNHIPWNKLLQYDKLYPEMAKFYHAPFRVVFSIYLIQQELQLPLSEIYEQLNENPYMRALCDFQNGEAIPPVEAMNIMLERLSDEYLQQINDICRQEFNTK